MISALLIYFAINSSTGGRQKQRGPNFEISIFVRSCYHHLEKVSYRNIFWAANLCFFYIFASKAPWYEGGTMVPWGRSDRWTLCFSILHWEMNLLPFRFTLRGEFVALLVHIERWVSLSRWQTLRGGGLRSTWLRWISWAWIFSSWRPAWTTRSTS